jgi:hypothetical protein
MSYEGKTRKNESKNNTDKFEPRFLRKIYMLRILGERVEKPRHHNHQYRIEMIGKSGYGNERNKRERKSTHRKKECYIIEEEKKCQGSFCDDELHLQILTWIFLDSFTDVLDFRHFSL